MITDLDAPDAEPERDIHDCKKEDNEENGDEEETLVQSKTEEENGIQKTRGEKMEKASEKSVSGIQQGRIRISLRRPRRPSQGHEQGGLVEIVREGQRERCKTKWI